MKAFKSSLLAAPVARFVLSLLFFCAFVASAEAAVKYVTPGGAGAKDGASWASAYGNAEFIINLPLASSGDEFWLAAGTYKPTTSTTDRTATFQLRDGVILYGGFSGTGTQRNPTANLTVLSGDIDSNDSQTPVITDIATVTGNTSNSYNVVKGATGATLDGFTITAGYANVGSFPYYLGGGMFNGDNSPMVANCTFTGNKAQYGGGMYNSATSNTTVTNCTFSGNTATINGGGMYNDDNSSPMLMSCTFSGNNAGPHGGGMYNGSGSGATVTNCTISGNLASEGGGMYDSTGSNTTVMNCTFSGNSAINAGGMGNKGSSPTVTNCTFAGNSADYNGGGIFNDLGSPTVTNCTFSGNTAETGPGMYTTSGSPVLTNCILWDASTPEISGGTPTVTYCVVQGGFTGTGNISVNPNLEPLANNGGFTQTHALPVGSSALDAGTGTGAPATDQRGVGRPQGAGIDIGSFERSPAIWYVTPSGAGAKDGASWATAYGNAEFITTLPLASIGTEFWLAAGVYKPTMNTADRNATFQLKDGVALYGGFAGNETDRESRNPTANLTVLSGDIDSNDSQIPVITDVTTVTGNTLNSQHVVTGATGATLDGFTITAGYAGVSGYGGGIYINYSSPTLVHCTISGNSAGHTGGGMFNDHGSPTLTHCMFSGNRANYGGGMRNDFSNLTVTDCTFSGNLAVVYGGGMFNDSGNPMVKNCTFSGNTATNNGGGMYSGGGSPTLANCTFSGNTADLGGGMYNINGSPGLTNCTFAGNTATSNGGGMYHHGIGSLTVANCIFWDASTPEISGGTPTVTYCVVQEGFTGTGNISVNPNLEPLANNGGFTQTHALPVGSSALDAGTGTGAPATDQRGVSRPQGIGIDIGAFELQAYQVTFASGAGGTISGDTPQTVYHGGSSAPVTANALAGFHFVSWTGGYSGTDNPLTVTNVTADLTITANFAISDSITITSPNGEESWTVGSGYNVTWTSIGALGNVSIDYSTDSGANWNPVASDTPNDGDYPWTIPDTPSTTCLVRIHEASDSDPSDNSDTFFSIVSPPETVSVPTAPAGVWTGFRVTSLSFTTGGSTSSLGHDIQYKLDWDDGSTSGWLATGTTSAAHSWAAAGTYNVRAMARCAAHPGVESPWSDTHAVVVTVPGQILCDFNFDGQTDLLWHNTATGANMVWYMDGVAKIGEEALPVMANLNFDVVGTGDFNADGKIDILWCNKTNGKNGVWFMDGAARIGSGALPDMASLNFEYVGVGDFNLDGSPDVMFRHKTTGVEGVWYLDGLTKIGNGGLPTMANMNFVMAGLTDFNADGWTDILWSNVANGTNGVWFMNDVTKIGSGALPPMASLNFEYVGVGDFNSDGDPDVIFRNKMTGVNGVWYLDGLTKIGTGGMPVLADLNWKIRN